MLYALYRRYLHRRPRTASVDGLLSIGVIGALSLASGRSRASPFGLGPVELLRFYSKSARVLPVHERERVQPLGRHRLLAADDRCTRHRRRLNGRRHPGAPLRAARSSSSASSLRALAAAPGDRARRARGAARSCSPRPRVEPPRLHAADAHARALHVPCARLPRAARRSRRFRWAYAALSALFLLNLWFAFTLLQPRGPRPGVQLPAGLRLAVRRLRTSTRGRSRPGRSRWSPLIALAGRLARLPLARRRTADQPSLVEPHCRSTTASRRPRRGGPAGLARRLVDSAQRRHGRGRASQLGRWSRWAPLIARRRSPAPSACGSCAARRSPADEPERQRLPPADGATGPSDQIHQGRDPARRLVPRPLARLVVLPPLPEPRRDAHRVHGRTSTGRERPDRPTSGSSTCCSRCGRSRSTLGARLLDWSRWTAAAAAAHLAADRQHAGLRLRARQLHVAGLRRVLAALGDVAPAARVGAHVARRLTRQAVRRPPASRSR